MSDRIEVNRKSLRDLYQQRPFRPFFIRLESGDRLDIEHPENVAFDPIENGGRDVFILTRDTRVFTSLDAVTGLALRPAGQAVSDNGR